METQTWLMILLWVLWAATAVQCGLAVNAYLVERQHGMQLSLVRVGAVTGVFLAATCLAVYAALVPQQTVAVVTAVPDKTAAAGAERPGDQKALADAQAKLANINNERMKLDARAADAQKELGAIQNRMHPSFFPRAVFSMESVTRQDRTVLAVTLVAMLAMAGFVVLALGGQVQTLFPPGWKFAGERTEDRASAERDLRELTRLVWNEKYRDALARGEGIPEKHLGSFDRLHLLFLRGYAGVQVYAFPEEGETREQRDAVIQRVIGDLEAVVEQAPNRGEAIYALALAYGLCRRDEESLEMFERSRALLSSEKLPFDENSSVCLLHLAEKSLSAGDTQQAEDYFGRVAGLGKLPGSVVESRLRVGMINLRGAMAREDVQTAAAALEQISGMTDLNPTHKGAVAAMRSALNARLALRGDDADTALAICSEFLAKHLPADLPPLEDDLADETFSALLDADLAIPREVFFGFLLMHAVAISKVETRRQHRLTEAQVTRLSEPLLRCLQFAPRQRDLLGSLGGLYYWFHREKREKAREWMESAVMMGVSGRIVRAILDRDRLIEMERRDALDWFRSASSRFLRDQTIATQVRTALIEELGRFQEFEPMLINLREQPEQEQEEPTIEILRERARYLADLIAGFAQRGNSERYSRLANTYREYTACLASLEGASQTMAEIESRVFSELGDTLVLS